MSDSASHTERCNSVVTDIRCSVVERMSEYIRICLFATQQVRLTPGIAYASWTHVHGEDLSTVMFD